MRPALLEDLVALQELARRTIDASYRSFLGNEGVDWFINSGASDDHIERHFRQGHVYCMEADREIVGLMILDGPTVDLMMIDVRRHRQGLGKLLLSRAEEVLFSQYPLQRSGQPEEVAALVAWLCSDECSFSTGAVFDISGGRATY